MKKTISFVMIGGFLGAGKTTLISRLGKYYQQQNKSIGLVTNDQAYGLVDTEQLRSQGFDVGEVPGACFCCKFNDLVETAEKLSLETMPDLIIAEPVGSCTDLMATVIEPIRQIYDDQFKPGPLTVLLKPEHGRKILSKKGKVGFSPKAAYIFEKQIEEANIVAINKIDKLSQEEVDELIGLVKERFPEKHVLPISGKEGLNFDTLVQAIENPEFAVGMKMDVDYDIYAEGEAELGWFNCEVTASSETVFSLDELVLSLVQKTGGNLKVHDLEPVHLKVMGQSSTESAVANLVSADDPPVLSLASEISTREAELIVNARVAANPEELEEIIRKSTSQLSEQTGIQIELRSVQSFKPGRPVPVHRIG